MKIFTFTSKIDSDIVDAFCLLERDFTDQFVYYDKQGSARLMGLGRCVAVSCLDGIDQVYESEEKVAPVFFSFNRFDEGNPSPVNPLFEAFPHLVFMLPELVLIHNDEGDFLQVNSLGPISMSRAKRFLGHIAEAPAHHGGQMSYTLTADSLEEWTCAVNDTLAKIQGGVIEKAVLSREQVVYAQDRFISCDMLCNLIDSAQKAVVFMYRYDDVFFIGSTPELLIRKRGCKVESMCLAGTIGTGATPEECEENAQALLHDDKNLREHAYVVSHLTSIFNRNCYQVEVSTSPGIMPLDFVQHLYTPIEAQVFEDTSLYELMRELHPTPALSGFPVGEAQLVLREEERYNRGFFGGPVGYVDGNGDGEYSVGIRSGVFDSKEGYIYAGCGIVDGSVPEEEYRETDLKFKTILSALGVHDHVG